MRSIVTDDQTAWDIFPRSRWMLNKLYVQEGLNNPCGPLGVEPSQYPVWIKPVINLYGLGIGSKKVESRYMMEYAPGMMWTPFYTGDHISYDIKYENDEIVEVYSAKGLNGPYFTEWHVSKIEPDPKLKFLVYKLSMIGKLPTYFNIETIDDKLIECHPRWSEEFIEYYDKCPFKQLILWSKDISEPKPDHWIDCRDDSCNDLMKDYKRIAFTYEFDKN